MVKWKGTGGACFINSTEARVSHTPEHMRQIGRQGGLVHREKGPNYYRELGRRGGQATKTKMEDEDFREEHARRSRLGKEFGVRLP